MSSTPIIAGDFVSASLTGTEATPSTTSVGVGHVTLPTTGFGGAVFTVSGTPGTIAFYASGDGGKNWQALNVMPSNSITPVSSISAAGLWRVNSSAFTHVSMVQTTAGTAGASIHASPISAGGTGGGGGGPGGPPSGPLTFNSVLLNVTTAYTPPAVSTYYSIGLGTAAIVPTGTALLVNGVFTITGTATNAVGYVGALRTTSSSVPPAGTNITTPPTGSVQTLIYVGAQVVNTNYQTRLGATIMDTGLVAGTPYIYYLGFIAYAAIATLAGVLQVVDISL